MRGAEWYFDFISPYAYLQNAVLARFAGRRAIERRPVLFAGLLNHWGQLGPAEIEPKRRFIYRHCAFQAEALGLPFVLPPRHPFNPLVALRFAVAAGATAAVVDAIFAWIWGEGRPLDTEDDLEALAGRLGIADVAARITEPEVKAALTANGARAIAVGVFGVPTLAIDGEIFWGFDATDMALAFIEDPAPFARGEMARAGALPIGAERRRS
jgi:2-hydroxychromene-2-carboxylate isomerase